jgi:hypothetical protein
VTGGPGPGSSSCPRCGRAYDGQSSAGVAVTHALPDEAGRPPAPGSSRRWRVVGALAVALVIGGVVHLRRPVTMLDERFDRPDGLVTNEFAHWNPRHAAAVRSETWDVTSGSLFASGGRGWTGRPDRQVPDEQSARSTNSAVFRLLSHEDRFEDVRVALDLHVDEFLAGAGGQLQDWDGVHIFLRYQSAQELYYASVARRDGTVVAKKKNPVDTESSSLTGESGYHTLASTHEGVHPGWHHVEARVRTLGGGSGTAIEVSIDGDPVLDAQDRGVGGPPISSRGRVGIRGDNTEFHVDNVVVAGI